MKYFIADLDNCFSDDKWREDLIDHHLTGNDKYFRYNTRMYEDPVKHAMIFHGFAEIARPVFFTGRCEDFKLQTERWIHDKLNHRLAYHMLMRGSEDRSRPVELKLKMLQRFLSSLRPGDEVLVAFDDLPPIIKMYRDNGIAGVLLQINPVSTTVYSPNDLKPL